MSRPSTGVQPDSLFAELNVILVELMVKPELRSVDHE
ncbi:MAG: hypothetical protein QOD82_3008, partial [Pseudonocardiales bacterium]|nr:hypothetical protein [Pseudonocardiales bacterium]